jgi:hypothetical protein
MWWLPCMQLRRSSYSLTAHGTEGLLLANFSHSAGTHTHTHTRQSKPACHNTRTKNSARRSTRNRWGCPLPCQRVEDVHVVQPLHAQQLAEWVRMSQLIVAPTDLAAAASAEDDQL